MFTKNVSIYIIHVDEFISSITSTRLPSPNLNGKFLWIKMATPLLLEVKYEK